MSSGRGTFVVFLLYYFRVFRLLDYITFGCFGTTGFILGRFIRPYCRNFTWNDTSIDKPFAVRETFPDWSLLIVAVVPCFIFVIIEKVRARFCDTGEWYLDPLVSERLLSSTVSSTNVLAAEGHRGRGGQPHEERNEMRESISISTHQREVYRKFVVDQVINQWILVVFMSVLFSLGVVDILKIYAGRLRPDFLDRLKIAGYNSSSEPWNLCGAVREGRLSFPSGHSSCAFAAFTPLTMYFFGWLRVFGSAPVWRIIVSLWPIYVAMWIAVSRIRDNRHHFSDILGGSAIGLFMGVLSVCAFFRVSEEEGYLVPRRIERIVSRNGHADPSTVV